MLRLIGTFFAFVIVLLTAAYFYLWFSPAPAAPHLSAEIQKGSMKVGAYERTYLTYVPKGLPSGAPLLLVLHGSLMDAKMMRRWTGYEFEELADKYQFAVVYPNGYERAWNTCQKSATFAAKKLDIDDMSFMRDLIKRMHAKHTIDLGRVYATGYSNGGQMVIRLALEASDEIAAIAAFGGNLPAPSNTVCTATGRPIPVMLTNGTSDPLVPYKGGEASLFGFGSRGLDLSAPQTAKYFAARNGISAPPMMVRLPQRQPSDPTWVERETWASPGKPDVILYTVFNGGHVVPQPEYRYPRILGNTTLDLNGPVAAWDFFSGRPQPTGHVRRYPKPGK